MDPADKDDVAAEVAAQRLVLPGDMSTDLARPGLTDGSYLRNPATGAEATNDPTSSLPPKASLCLIQWPVMRRG